eukprot:scaffold5917_cov31-Tisochrysis_lutea.AAC.4
MKALQMNSFTAPAASARDEFFASRHTSRGTDAAHGKRCRAVSDRLTAAGTIPLSIVCRFGSSNGKRLLSSQLVSRAAAVDEASHVTGFPGQGTVPVGQDACAPGRQNAAPVMKR